jgi:glycosyltransferase involved in cell wall biosynthesis
VIEAVGVVIPAHNEEDLLPACLAAVRQAAWMLEAMPVCLVVAADACRDLTARRARDGGAEVVEIRARSVGIARDAGMAEVLAAYRHLDPASVWLATTDADTLVPPDWLVRQVRHADHGWDTVVGTVTVTDWTGHPPEVPPRYAERYGASASASANADHGHGSHPHVHGANLGFTAKAYLAAGGFGSRRTAEDHALVRALDAAGSRILRTTQVNVVTSARRHARAPSGFSHLLSSLAAAD